MSISSQNNYKNNKESTKENCLLYILKLEVQNCSTYRVSIHVSVFMYIFKYTCHGINGVEVSGQLLVPVFYLLS